MVKKPQVKVLWQCHVHSDRVSYQSIIQYKKLVQKEEEVTLLQLGKKKKLFYTAR